jgi:hypothetical protein
MTLTISSLIMRTTVDIDDPILREVKAIHEREGRSMGPWCPSSWQTPLPGVEQSVRGRHFAGPHAR